MCYDKFRKAVILYRRKNVIYKSIEAILKEYEYCKQIIKKHLNKNLNKSAADEEKLQLSNKCWDM